MDYETIKLTKVNDKFIALAYNHSKQKPYATWMKEGNSRYWIRYYTSKKEAVADYYYRVREAEDIQYR